MLEGTGSKLEVGTERALRLGPPTSVVLATCASKSGRPNIITLGRYMHVSNDPPLVAIGVSPKRHSHRLIEETGEFVVNVPPKALIKQIVLCGESSGRRVDKFELTGLTPIPARKVGAPLIKECVSHLECKVVRRYRTGDHTLFLGKVVAASVDRGMLKGTLDISRAETVLHKGGRYFTPKFFYGK
ncbi:MAG: flavin reductase family protein [Candidatus Brockarchaeota archaeon]|nr:flavin reductase family protein [Candidatus Brockarchaeota archaeon]